MTMIVRDIKADERERCIAEIRRVEGRNTNTTLDASQVWNKAVATMADECVDAIANLD